ncbi:hypothetical protein OSTOST_02623 [Ostertagia ostertagi]
MAAHPISSISAAFGTGKTLLAAIIAAHYVKRGMGPIIATTTNGAAQFTNTMLTLQDFLEAGRQKMSDGDNATTRGNGNKARAVEIPAGKPRCVIRPDSAASTIAGRQKMSDGDNATTRGNGNKARAVEYPRGSREVASSVRTAPPVPSSILP